MQSETPTHAKVQLFLEELSLTDPDKYEILSFLRKIVFGQGANISEKMMYGGIIFSFKGEDFGGVFAYKKHVSMEFSQGYKFDDPQKLLEGSGKFRRHLKFLAKEEVAEKNVRYFIEQALTNID